MEGRAAPPPWPWCLLGDLCFLCGFWLVTRQSDASYLRFRGVTKCPTQACTIPVGPTAANPSPPDLTSLSLLQGGSVKIVMEGEGDEYSVQTDHNMRRNKSEMGNTHFCTWVKSWGFCRPELWFRDLWHILLFPRRQAPEANNVHWGIRIFGSYVGSSAVTTRPAQFPESSTTSYIYISSLWGYILTGYVSSKVRNE
jgi:hypothetical protein